MKFAPLCALGLFILWFSLAQADSPFAGEIRMYGGGDTTYLPAGWRLADGTTLSTSSYPDLYNAIGCNFTCPGAGQFKLPDFRSRGPMGYQSGSSKFAPMGKTGGEITHTQTIAEMPAHTHPIYRSGANYLPAGSANQWPVGITTNAGDTTQSTGGGGAFNVLDPYLTVTFIIYVGGADLPTATPTATSTATLTPTATPTSTATPTGTVAPTATDTPTATPTGSIYLPNISAYTHTLTSGKELYVPVEVSFGQIVIGGLLITVCLVVLADMMLGLFFFKR